MMMNASHHQLHRLNPTQSSSSSLLHKPFILSHGRSISSPAYLPTRTTLNFHGKKKCFCIRASATDVRGVETSKENAASVKAVVRATAAGLLSDLGITKPLDVYADLVGKTLLLELVSAEVDSGTGLEKGTIKGYARKVRHEKEEVIYESEFIVPAGFGEVGAILVENEHHKEMFLNNIVLDGLHNGPIHINCSSWVHSKFDNPKKRIFFTNKSYLPDDTPSGLKKLREIELENLRGNGKGERKTSDRIYDYDTYNDLGNPDDSEDLARPILGSKDHPYPRRCRTGRPSSKKDPLSETRSSSVYVPRDEAFEEVKQLTFSTKTLKSVLHALLPQVEIMLLDPHLGFPYFTAIDSLFQEGVTLPKSKNFFQSIIPRLVKTIAEREGDILLFETPAMIDRDKFAWFRDEEFSRQALAGLNPYSLQLVTEWPLKSELDPEIYGPPESLITAELIEKEIKGVMTIDEALKQKKMFILDYHDLLLPYVDKVREIEGTTLYGSRTLFFLTMEGTLRPLAIELTRPPVGDKPQWKQVFTPGWDATSCWLWRLAKTHVCAHDSGYHQLVVHW